MDGVVRRRGFRVYLRPPCRDDWPIFQRAVSTSRRHLRPWTYPPATEDAFVRWVSRAELPTHRFFLICRTDDTLVGVLNLSEIVQGCLHGCFMGCYLFAEHGGRGFMTEAMCLGLDHAFDALRLHRIEANIQPGNDRSIALVRRLGFRLEGFSPRYLKIGGRWRDHERWAVTVEDWRLCRAEVETRRRARVGH